jgi:hypothetical protein
LRAPEAQAHDVLEVRHQFTEIQCKTFKL